MFFEREKLTLRVPISKAATSGMRKLSDPSIVEKALQVLTGRARVNRAMWSRRATEYQTKINSGDLLTVAEVVRDLFRAPNQPEASYSERGLYEAASMLLAREISAVKNITETEALKLIEQSQSKSAQQAAAVEPDDGAQAAA
jgi:CarD family transcriptional regulator